MLPDSWSVSPATSPSQRVTSILRRSSSEPSPRQGVRARVAAVLGILLGAACSGDGTGPGEPTRITIEPSAPVALYVGDTLQVRATITGTPRNRVVYNSSAPGIVEIDPERGLARALMPGEAVINGLSAIDPRIVAQLQVTVAPDPVATLEFVALATVGGEALPLDAVEGRVVARLRLRPGNARRLEIRLREEAVCTEELTPAPPGTEADERLVDCEFDTGAFDDESGAVRFANGAALLQAVLLAVGDREVGSLSPLALELQNRPRIAASIEAERTARDSEGAQWLGGSLVVTAVPVLYDGGEVASVRMTFASGNGGDSIAASAAGSPFTFIVPGNGILAGVTDPALRFTLTSTTRDGDPGPRGESPRVRYDAQGPTPGALRPREWIGDATRFIDLYSRDGESDSGVGRVRVDFTAGDPRSTPAEILASGTPVERGGDLEQGAAGSYRLVAHVCDVLDNCVLADGFDFGVDLTPPLVEGLVPGNHAVNPGEDLVAALRDDLSGFPDRPLEVSVRRLRGGEPAACGPLVEGIDLPGRPAGSACVADTVTNQVAVPRSTGGYYHYAVVGIDRAGNRSAHVDRIILVDLEPPVIGGIALVGRAEPGVDAPVDIDVSDDVDLHIVDLAFVFAAGDGVLALPFAPGVTLGTPFGEVLTASERVRVTNPFVRTLTLAGAGQGRPTHLADSLRVTARDVAGLQARRSLALTPADYGGDTTTTDPFPRFSAASVAVDRVSICTEACADGDPTVARVSVRVDGESGTGRPFARLHVMLLDPSGEMLHVGDLPGSESSIINVGNRSSYEYNVDLTPPPGLAGDYNVIAVGVNSRGNALATDLANAPAITLYAR